jgi:nucleoside-diphosphate-sugar epimerase
MERKRALVLGGLGVIGRNLVQHLTELDDWDVIAVSRREPDFETRADYRAIDLLDDSACHRELGALDDVTHVFFAAYQARLTRAEEVQPNLAMLVNAVRTVERSSPRLQHISLMQGGKVYGCHLGPFKTPAKESDPRHLPPNFYYDQEDFLRAQQEGKTWTWSALRPEAVCGFALGNPMNIAMVIAIYATLSKELGLPLRFPGKPGAYSSLYQVTDAELLARATVWAATESACGNEAFNITNGDYFRWKNLWPRFAEFFDMELGDPQTLQLTDVMPGLEPVWNECAQRHDLRRYPYRDVAHWGFGDVVFGIDYDNISSTMKARRYGFTDCRDTEEMFLDLFGRLRRERVIP